MTEICSANSVDLGARLWVTALIDQGCLWLITSNAEEVLRINERTGLVVTKFSGAAVDVRCACHRRAGVDCGAIAWAVTTASNEQKSNKMLQR